MSSYGIYILVCLFIFVVGIIILIVGGYGEYLIDALEYWQSRPSRMSR